VAAISVGSVSVDVVPSVRNFARDLRKQVVPQATKIGVEVGKAIGAGIRKGIGDPLSGPVDESARKQQGKAPRQGERVAGAFAEAFQRRLRAAFAALPDAKIDADSSPADRKIAELRARLEALSKKTIGVDVDAGAAMAEVAAIKAQLADLGRTQDIQVRVDAGAAEAELAAVQAQVSRIDGRTANVRVDADVSGALAGIATVGIALAGLAAIPVGATVGAGILALAPALGAAGAGFAGLGAVAVPALSRIHTALQAQKQATQAAAAAGGQARSSAVAQAGAQRQLAAAVRNAGYAHTQTLDQVRQAEQRYRQSLQAEAEAQRSLTQARLAARRSIEDLKNQVIDAGLAVRDAELGIEESRLTWQQMAAAARTAAGQVAAAQTALAKAQAAQQTVLASPAATDATKRQAQASVDAAAAALKGAQDQQKAADLAARHAEINYRQSVQRLKEQQLQLRRLQTDERAAAKAGVEGSDQVRQARQRLAQANQQVTNSELALRRARENVRRVDAQSADQIAAARAAAAQAAQAGVQGAAANTKLAASMAALSPSARKLMKDWVGLKDAFGKWTRSLEPDVLPLFSHGIRIIKASLPGLTPIVKGAAGAVDGLLTDVEQAAKSPFWKQFRTNMTALVPTAITGLGHVLGNVITGVAGIVNAFLPYAPAILGWLVRITGQFANWGKNLGGSPQFTQFMDYVKEVGPQVAHTIALVAGAVGHVVASLAGLGPVALVGIVGLARVLSSLSPGQIQAIAVAFIAFRSLILVNTLATRAAVGIGRLALAVRTGGREGPLLARGLVLAARGITTVSRAALSGVVALGRLAASMAATTARAAAGGIAAAGRNIAAMASAARQGVTAFVSLAVSIGRATVAATVNAARTFAVAVAQRAVRVVTLAWAAAQWALNVAMRANPIGLIITALVALVGAVVYAYIHFETFRKIVNGVFAWLKSAVLAVLGWVRSHWPLLVSIMLGPVGLLVALIIKKWSSIKSVFSAGIAWVTSRWKSFWNGVFSFASSLTGRVQAKIDSFMVKARNAFSNGVAGIKSAWHRLESAAKTPVNFVIGTVFNKGIARLWNNVIGWLHLPGGLKIGTMPLLEAGGTLTNPAPAGPMVTNRPTAIVGEGGKHPEYVIPTDPKYRSRAQGLWAAAGGDLQMLRKGGILGSVWGGIKTAAGKVISLGKLALDLIAHPGKVWDALAAKAIPGFGHLNDGSLWGQAMVALPKMLLGRAKEAALSAIGAFNVGFGGGGNIGVVNAARKYLGVPYLWGGTSHSGIDCSGLTMRAWLEGANKNITRTTGTQHQYLKRIPRPRPGSPGQPHSGHTYLASRVQGNRTWVVEAAHSGTRVSEHLLTRATPWWGWPPGMASGGVLAGQLGSRFVRGSGKDWQQAQLLGLAGDPGGILLDSGGYLPAGPSLVYNGTGRPEPVLTGRQMDALSAAAAGEEGGKTVNVMPNSTVYVQDPTDVDALAQRTEFAARAATF
jgi:hypothetical protein